MLCKFGHEVPHSADYCPVCGSAIESAMGDSAADSIITSPDAAQAGWYDDPSAPSMLRYWDGTKWTDHQRANQIPPMDVRPFYKKKRVLLPALALITLIAIGAIAPDSDESSGGSKNSSSQSGANAETSNINQYLRPGHKHTQAIKSACLNWSKLYSRTNRANNHHLDQIRRSGAVSDPYKAYEFVDIAWMSGTSFEQKFTTSVATAVGKTLKGQFLSNMPENLKDDFTAEAMDACEKQLRSTSKPTNRSALAIAKRLDASIAKVHTQAENRPWYPRGFSEYSGDSSIATKWDNSGGVDCYECTYAKLLVLSQSGCPNGLYAEVNFLNSSGVVEDWTNDTVASLNGNATALLTFESYGVSGTGTVQIADINCY